jgi:glycosyltransferase involved in cell wall biosynthesis
MTLRLLLLAQLRALRDAGAEVVGISATGPWVPELEQEGIRHVPLESSTRATDLLADFRAAAELRRILRRERPTILHVHNPKPGVYGRIVGRLVRVPIVVHTMHGLYATETDPWSKRAAVYALEAVASRCSDAELVQNPEDLDLLHRRRISPRARLLGNGVDLERFQPGRAEHRRAVRASFGISDDVVVVGSVGRLVAEKGFVELFEAFARLDSSRYALLVAGGADSQKPDTLDPGLVARAEANGVRFLGHRDDVEAVYAAMDLFVLASHREGYPRAAMEAAASGLPLVVTDIRGCRQVVDDGENGVIVALRDVNALTAAIAALGEDPTRRAAAGQASRMIACERFDERAVVRKVLDTYREIADAKGVPLPLSSVA